MFLAPKTTALPKSVINIEETERAAEKIHAEIPALRTPEPVAEITKRVTLDIPLSLHAAIKMRTFQTGSTIKDYLLTLAARDLGV